MYTYKSTHSLCDVVPRACVQAKPGKGYRHQGCLEPCYVRPFILVAQWGRQRGGEDYAAAALAADKDARASCNMPLWSAGQIMGYNGPALVESALAEAAVMGPAAEPFRAGCRVTSEVMAVTQLAARAPLYGPEANTPACLAARAADMEEFEATVMAAAMRVKQRLKAHQGQQQQQQ